MSRCQITSGYLQLQSWEHYTSLLKANSTGAAQWPYPTGGKGLSRAAIPQQGILQH